MSIRRDAVPATARCAGACTVAMRRLCKQSLSRRLLVLSLAAGRPERLAMEEMELVQASHPGLQAAISLSLAMGGCWILEAQQQ